jgi:hypothetical protein
MGCPTQLKNTSAPGFLRKATVKRESPIMAEAFLMWAGGRRTGSRRAVLLLALLRAFDAGLLVIAFFGMTF